VPLVPAECTICRTRAVITDQHRRRNARRASTTGAWRFIVPLILLGAAIFIWLTVRNLIRADGGRVGRLVRLWFDAKERELRERSAELPALLSVRGGAPRRHEAFTQVPPLVDRIAPPFLPTYRGGLTDAGWLKSVGWQSE
jgi:hypothetical protein